MRSGGIVRVVDDTDDIAGWLKHALEAEGIKSEVWTEHFEALLEPGAWDGINAAVVDLMLGAITGDVILRHLNENEPQIRRIAMTAALNLAPDLAGLADVVLIKPFHSSDLVAALS